MLCDSVPDEKDYEEINGCYLNKFPLKKDSKARVFLNVLKMGKFHELKTGGSKCIDYDSQFTVMLANAEAYEDEKEDDEVKLAYLNK